MGTRETFLCSASSKHHQGLPFYIYCEEHTKSKYMDNLETAGKAMEKDQDVNSLLRSIEYLSELLANLGMFGGWVATHE